MGIFIRDDVLNKIDSAKDRIDERRIKDYIELVHSNLLSQVADNTSALDEDNALRGKKIVKNFRNAWEYSVNNFNGEIDSLFLQEIVGRLEPDLCLECRTYAPIRDCRAQMQIEGSPYIPPSDKERISLAIQRMFEAADMQHFHPVEESAFYNLNLSRIQIFENANKRLANIVMNTLLYKNGYFPINIKPQQSQTFKLLLGRAIRGFSEVSANEENHIVPYLLPDENQTRFFGFLGERELSELSMAEDSLRGMPTYYIEFDKVKNKGRLFSIKRSVGAWFSSQGLPYQAKLKASQNHMEVIGRIPEETLVGILNRNSHKSDYKIKNKGIH